MPVFLSCRLRPSPADLKPENYVFTSQDESSPMRLIDFGCAKVAADDEVISDVAGSPYYCSPEVSQGHAHGQRGCGAWAEVQGAEKGVVRGRVSAGPRADTAPFVPTCFPALSRRCCPSPTCARAACGRPPICGAWGWNSP